MLQPVRRRTWAPCGETPLQRAWDRHDRLSAIAALTLSPIRRDVGLYFQLLDRNIQTEDMIWFLTRMALPLALLEFTSFCQKVNERGPRHVAR